MQEIKISKKDLTLFHELKNDREICIKEASSKDMKKSQSQEISDYLHPSTFWITVKEILDEGGHSKTFVFESSKEHHLKLPLFQPGQYLVIEVEKDGGIYRRPYSFCSSPKNVLKNEFRITINRVSSGIVSNFFLDEVHVGDTFQAHGPFGNFVYQPLRDANHIIGIAGGSGITPFLSILEAIHDHTIDATMTLLYGVKTENDILFKERLDELQNDEKISVTYILSEEEKEGYQTGVITKEMIQECQREENSYFVCGPLGLYRSMNEIFKELLIPNKYIRHDSYSNYERSDNQDIFTIHVLTNDEEKIISCKGNETLMSAMERSGIKAPKRCGVGVCGFCRSKLIDGDVLTSQDFVRKADQRYHYIHPCATYPLSDVTIELPN